MDQNPKARILVVEDEPLAALEMQETLASFGYDVPEPLSSGDQVLGAVMSLRPSLIIMDIHLKSYIDGVDAVSRLRMVSSAPVIFITAYPAKSVEDRALAVKPAAYLQKPIDSETLRLAVEKALAG